MNKKFLELNSENPTSSERLDVKAISMKTTLLFILVSTFIITGCSGKSVSDVTTTDPGVVINGITWATRNVDAPGTFAETNESAGMFYQWNSNIGWSSSNPIKNTNGDYSWIMIGGGRITEWTKENDPCPEGWRLPTKEEIKELLDTGKVIKEWGTLHGVKGMLFTDKASGNNIFLPAAGHRSDNGSLYLAGIRGDYMSRSITSYYAHYLHFDEINSGCGDGNISGQGNSIRCVHK